MSGPSNAPSPAPRSASIGPAAGMSMPSQQQVNGGGSMGGGNPSGGGGGGGGGGQMSQQNLNQIVIDYLAKKGYNKTEAMLRMESANMEIDGRQHPARDENTRPIFLAAFDLVKKWIEDNLDIYKPELRRVLWPLFIYSYLDYVAQFYPEESRLFFDKFKEMFSPEHSEDLRVLATVRIPEHLQTCELAKLYRSNKYRLPISKPAFFHLVQFLESKGKEGALLNALLSGNCNVVTVDRASDDRYSLAAILARTNEVQDMPGEDEGIPGHNPGSAFTDDNPARGSGMPKLRLGKLPMESDLEGDVRAELDEIDAKEPPAAGKNTLVQELDQMIKQEDDDEFPTRAELPFPPSIARDVALEVQKVKENRDRFRIETRTSGVGPAVSVCMFTFHNTYDCITCLDFSGDNMLAAAGTDQSYIRIWSLDGKPIRQAYPNEFDPPPANSRKLIGHSGPVYAVAFSPSITQPAELKNPTNARWLLSSSEDKTIRLWNLDTWQQIVQYKGHDQPVWDVKWGPHGHYFVSGGHDKTARLWSTDQIRQLRIFAGHDQDVDVACFHPNSAYVFTGSSDRTVRMWAVTTGNPVRMFTGHTGNITAMACSHTGKILATADDHGAILLWDLAPGRLLKRMRGHGKGGIWSLSWCVESTVLVSGGADGTVRVWDVFGPGKEPGVAGKIIGEAGAATKIDGGGAAGAASATATAAATGTGPGSKKKGKDVVVSQDQISAFPTKKSPVYKVQFTGQNLVVAGGAYLP